MSGCGSGCNTSFTTVRYFQAQHHNPAHYTIQYFCNKPIRVQDRTGIMVTPTNVYNNPNGWPLSYPNKCLTKKS